MRQGKKRSPRVETVSSQEKKQTCISNIPCGDGDGTARVFEKVERLKSGTVRLTFARKTFEATDAEFISAKRLNLAALAKIQRVPVLMAARNWKYLASCVLRTDLREVL